MPIAAGRELPPARGDPPPIPAADCLRALWRDTGLAESPLASVQLSGAEPVLPSSFAIGTAAQASIAASALAAAEVWRQRGGTRQSIAVDKRNAAIEFRGENYLRVDGAVAGEIRDPISRTFRCGDGRWVRVHANFPHHRDGILKLLGCAHDAAAVGRALERWEALRFEDAAADAQLVVTAMRSFAEWDAHPQGAAVRALPLFSLEKIAEAPPLALAPADQPLAGVRVLDLTRVIAGPVCGRTLAGHGADVLLVTSPHLPAIEPFVIETGIGKLSCALDLRESGARATLRTLLAEADVFVQGYRPGGIAALGFGPQDAAQLRPGIVYVTLNAYGQTGPWAERRGYDSLVQTASGFNDAEARAAGSDKPKPLPTQALDRATGYLMAFGVCAALLRRAEQGGSWHLRFSLAQTGHWLRGLGRVADGLALADPQLADVLDLTESLASGFGTLTTIRHAARLAKTPFRWARPSLPLGSSPPRWP